LRIEGSDFTIIPASENALTVFHEGDAVAFEVWHLDTKEFLAIVGVPDSDVVDGASSKNIRVIVWEGHIVYSRVMASVSQLSV